MAKLEQRYQKMPNIYRKEAQNIFSLNEVVVTEKVDGTNFSVGRNSDGFVVMNSRNNVMWIDKQLTSGPDHILQFDGFGAVDRFKELHGEVLEKIKDLPKGTLIFGEFYGRGIQKRINYGEEKLFVFFDVWQKGDYLPFSEAKEIIQSLGLPLVPLLYKGKPGLKIFEKLQNLPSTQAQLNGVSEPQIQEGIVISSSDGQKDKWGERIACKYKSEQFAEVKRQTHGTKKPHSMKEIKAKKEELDFHSSLCEKYITEGRLHNCLEKLRSENVPMLKQSTGRVIKALVSDAEEEMESEDKSNPLYSARVFRKVAGREVAHLFDNFLKEEFLSRVE